MKKTLMSYGVTTSSTTLPKGYRPGSQLGAHPLTSCCNFREKTQTQDSPTSNGALTWFNTIWWPSNMVLTAVDVSCLIRYLYVHPCNHVPWLLSQGHVQKVNIVKGYAWVNIGNLKTWRACPILESLITGDFYTLPSLDLNFQGSNSVILFHCNPSDQPQGHFTRDVQPCQCDTAAPPFYRQTKTAWPWFHCVRNESSAMGMSAPKLSDGQLGLTNVVVITFDRRYIHLQEGHSTFRSCLQFLDTFLENRRSDFDFDRLYSPFKRMETVRSGIGSSA